MTTWPSCALRSLPKIALVGLNITSVTPTVNVEGGGGGGGGGSSAAAMTAAAGVAGVIEPCESAAALPSAGAAAGFGAGFAAGGTGFAGAIGVGTAITV